MQQKKKDLPQTQHPENTPNAMGKRTRDLREAVERFALVEFGRRTELYGNFDSRTSHIWFSLCNAQCTRVSFDMNFGKIVAKRERENMRKLYIGVSIP